MKSEFALAFNQICAEYNLPRETVLEAVSAALGTAYRRDWKVAPNQNVVAEISMETGLARIYLEKTVVETVADPDVEITQEEARRVQRGVQVGDAVLIDVTPHNFGRIAAQTAKQVITQRLREAERESQFTRFSRQENEIIIGTIQSINPQGITLHLDRTEEAHMPRREQIPGERYSLHQKIRVYVVSVRKTPRGPEVVVSRSHPFMLRRLLELEVPEIRNGQVEIKAIAREAGTRAKVAVATREPGLDPVGACVGIRGIRIQTISRELHNERVDVIAWDEAPFKFIANALSLDHVISVIIDEGNPGGKTAAVVVADEQLSLAIGRSGQNARLAAKLTGWRIDIQGATEAALWALEQINQTPELLAAHKESAALVPRLAGIMRMHEAENYPYTDEERATIKGVVEAIRLSAIALREKERPLSRQTRARREAQAQADAVRQAAVEEAQAKVPANAYQTPIDTLELSDKLFAHLQNNGVATIGQIMERVALGDEALLMLNGIGIKAMNEIKAAIEASPFKFRKSEAETDAAIADVAPVEAAATADEAVALAAEPVIETTITAMGETMEEAATEEAGGEAVTATPVVAVETADIEVKIEAEALSEDAAVSLAAEGEAGIAPLLNVVESEYEEDDEEFDTKGKPSKRKKNKRRAQTLMYDEDSGETVVEYASGRWQSLQDEYLD